MKRKGFSLIEAVMVSALSSVAIMGVISHQTEKTNELKIKNFVNEAYSVVEAVDHRISIDGYDISNWSRTNWNSETNIVNDLIKKKLTSKHLTNCSGGDWEPLLDNEKKVKIIECDLWKTRTKHNEKMNAFLSIDSAGYISSFTLDIRYLELEDFKDSILSIKKAMNEIDFKQERAGSHYVSFVSLLNEIDLTTSQCVDDFKNCVLRLRLERNGGNEYLRVDGENSMIGSHIAFIEAKGQAPLKCVKWKNTKEDGTGVWSKTLDEECGIGVYKESGHPVIAEASLTNGSFKNVLLDKDCRNHIWDGGQVVESATISPCGMLSKSEVVVVADNIQAKDATIKNVNFSFANINSIFSDKITSRTIEATEAIESLLGDFTHINTESLNANNASIGTITSNSVIASVGQFDNINDRFNLIEENMNNLNEGHGVQQKLLDVLSPVIEREAKIAEAKDECNSRPDTTERKQGSYTCHSNWTGGKCAQKKTQAQYTVTTRYSWNDVANICEATTSR